MRSSLSQRAQRAHGWAASRAAKRDDGAVCSTFPRPMHTYASPGLYVVTLTATNPAGSSIASDAVTVYGLPLANFIAYPTEGFHPLTVTFTNTTATTPPGDPSLTYRWRFGDEETSTQPSPTHIYAAAGVYDVALEVSNAVGSGVLTHTKYITVYQPVAAIFEASPRDGAPLLTVHFTDMSTGPISVWEWDFGDGEASNHQHPTHTYATAGVFTVDLTVRAAGGAATLSGGTDTLTKAGYIKVEYSVYLPFVLRNH